jgi:hypothetical protein
MLRTTRIRKTPSTLCALALACLTVPAVHAGQTDTTAKKPATAKTKPHSAATKSASSKSTTASSSRRTRKKKSVRTRGQQKIDAERATAIQEALIREHYLSGEARGTWNQASEDAMRKYQADNGWQSKTVPDSRALIKLGLGPSKDHLLNPESAMTTVPDPPRVQSLPTTSHTAAPVSATPVTPTQSDPPSPQ